MQALLVHDQRECMASCLKGLFKEMKTAVDLNYFAIFSEGPQCFHFTRAPNSYLSPQKTKNTMLLKLLSAILFS